VTTSRDNNTQKRPCKKGFLVKGPAYNAFEGNHWEIDIDSLADIIALTEEVGEIIFWPLEPGEQLPRIEIYNGYRE